MKTYGYEGEEKFAPLSPWAYFGYSVLFAIPLIGLIFLIVLTFNDNNINRRNFARSYWIAALLVLALTLLLLGRVVDLAFHAVL